MSSTTDGALRYRLELGEGPGPAASSAADLLNLRVNVRDAARTAYALNPRVLNDPRQSTWVVDVSLQGSGDRPGASPRSADCPVSIELRPRPTPNPRLAYRTQTYYAGAHPPLAAAMVRMAGRLQDGDLVWDPFCGSAMELIEAAIAATAQSRALGDEAHRGGSECVTAGRLRLVGTDIDPAAISVAEDNFAAALRAKSGAALTNEEVSDLSEPLLAPGTQANFEACDFREAQRLLPGMLGSRGQVRLIITNPPLGRRVKVKKPRALFYDLFDVSGKLLQRDGHLVLINPLRVTPRDSDAWTLESRVMVDLGLRKMEPVETWRKTK